MTGLSKSYLGVLLLLGLGLVLVLADSVSQVSTRTEDEPVALAGMPGHCLAVPYFESRWRIFDQDSAVLFPGMRPLSTMDFVYAR